MSLGTFEVIILDNGILVVVGIIYAVIMVAAIALFMHFKRKGALNQSVDSKQDQTMNIRNEHNKQ